MADLSIITLLGRLTRDAELKYTNGGMAHCTFSVATNSRVKRGSEWKDEPSYWTVDLWGKQGESLINYLTKGKQVAVTGQVRIEKWEHEGKSYQAVKVTADNVVLVGSRESQNSGHSEAQTGSDNAGYQEAPENRTTARHSEQGGHKPQGRNPAQQPADGFEDDIPF